MHKTVLDFLNGKAADGTIMRMWWRAPNLSDDYCVYVLIDGAWEMPNGDVLVGHTDAVGTSNYVEYDLLSELKFAWSGGDQECDW